MARFFNVDDVEKIDLSKLARLLPSGAWNPLSTQAQYISAILQSEEMLRANGINNAQRLAHFLGQGLVETGWLAYKAENLNYSFASLKRVFGHKFANDDEIRAYARQPQRIANRVYGNRMGNGPEDSGDGWRYRGRGFFQLTGKDNYRRYGEMAGIDLINDPDIIERDLRASLQVAAAFFNQTGLGEYADRNDIAAVSRGVNRGNPRSSAPAHGEAERIQWTTRALALVRDPASVFKDGESGPAPTPEAPQDLRSGSTGAAVQALQRQLNALGYAVGADDGVFGPATHRAVVAFQQEHGLPTTGAVDGATKAAIDAALAEEPATPTRPEIPSTPDPQPPAEGQLPTPTPPPSKPVTQSRTIWGAILAFLAGIVSFVHTALTQAAAVFPVIGTPWGPLNTIWILAGLFVLGIAIVIYARLDDRAKRRK